MPAAPVITAVQGPALGQITVSWPAVVGATSYRVYYDDDATHPPWDPTVDATEGSTPITTAALTQALSGLPPGIEHHVQVTAVDGGGEGPYSNLEILEPLGCPDPADILIECAFVPVNFQIVGSGFDPAPFIDLEWDPASPADWAQTIMSTAGPAGEGGVTNSANCLTAHGITTAGYRLYRNEQPCNPFLISDSTLIVDEAVLTPMVGEYRDLSVVPGREYVYTLVAVGNPP